MAKPHLGPLKPFSTIRQPEIDHMHAAMSHPLSGYIGGNPKGGYWVERLSEKWEEAFSARYAIPCNSATSGLLAACMAIGVRHDQEVWCTSYSMSATAACAKVLGAKVKFLDIDEHRFSPPPPTERPKYPPKAVILTNLFGHPAYLHAWREWCDRHSVWLIEDNAQAPLAMEQDSYTGTIGHIGIFSLNIHKAIQCGEGGVIVTDNNRIAQGLYDAINHGELAEPPIGRTIGLNLRMTEPIAAIACAQLAKAPKIIEGRRQIGLELCDMVKDVPWIKAHTDQPGCTHVYYLWTALTKTVDQRDILVEALKSYGLPIRGGYAPLLNKLFRSADQCPFAEDIDSRIIVFEVCAYQLENGEMKTIRDIFKRVTGEVSVAA